MKWLIILLLLAGPAFAEEAEKKEVKPPVLLSSIGECIGWCSSEQGICIASCQGNGQCIGQCAAAHGRCVSRCNR